MSRWRCAKQGMRSDVALDGSRVVDIANRYGREGQFDYAGIAVWSPAVFQRIPPGQNVSFIPILAEWIGQGGKIGGVPSNDAKWFNIGSRREYLDGPSHHSGGTLETRLRHGARVAGERLPGRAGRSQRPALGLSFGRRRLPGRCGSHPGRHDSLARRTNRFPKLTSVTVLSAPNEKPKVISVTSTSKTARTDLLLRQTRIHFPRSRRRRSKSPRSRKGDRTGSSTGCGVRLTRPSSWLSTISSGKRTGTTSRSPSSSAEHKIRAPKIYFHDPAEGLIWIEDLGKSGSLELS